MGRTEVIDQISDKLLTAADVEGLPDGTEVYIRWAGGKGPALHKIKQTAIDMTLALKECRNSSIHWLHYVGNKRYNTQVCMPNDLKSEIPKIINPKGRREVELRKEML